MLDSHEQHDEASQLPFEERLALMQQQKKKMLLSNVKSKVDVVPTRKQADEKNAQLVEEKKKKNKNA